jgi:uncharacterized protein (DUF2267 family)
MRYQNFIERVQEVARLESREEAARASVATLETLGERISPREREELAAQLTSELEKPLCARHPHTLFPLEEFYDRLGARADLHYRDAVERAHLGKCAAISSRHALSRLSGRAESPCGRPAPYDARAARRCPAWAAVQPRHGSHGAQARQ